MNACRLEFPSPAVQGSNRFQTLLMIIIFIVDNKVIIILNQAVLN